MRYQIEVRGEFDELLSNAFSKLAIEAGNGRTIPMVDAVDSAGLFTILDRLPDFAVEVVSFRDD